MLLQQASKEIHAHPNATKQSKRANIRQEGIALPL